MKSKFHFCSVVFAALVINASAADSTTTPKESVFPTKPLGITLSIKMVGPYMEPADLQIICKESNPRSRPLSGAKPLPTP